MNRVARVLLLLALALVPATRSASAADVSCIEASKYKYLFLLFDNDPRKFAAYFNLPPGQLPRPDYCRAVLVNGGYRSEADITQVMRFIVENRGWLSEIYLQSGGGLVLVGVGTGILARNFWLKTHNAMRKDGALVYEPDFAVPPPEALEAGDTAPPNAPTFAGWRAYRAAVAALPRIEIKSHNFCASACTQTLAGGVDRIGTARVHRAAGDRDTLQKTNESLLKTDEYLVSFYNFMDAGADFMKTYLATSILSIAPLGIDRYPRHVYDVVSRKCNADLDQYVRLESQIDATIADFRFQAIKFDPSIDLGRLHAVAKKIRLRRMAIEQCWSALYEKERLTAFATACPRGCDQAQMFKLIDAKSQDIHKQLNWRR